MNGFKQKGDTLQGKYRILSRFPFVDGVLYYAEITRPQEEGGTCFIHALRLPEEPDPAGLEELRFRSGKVFFPMSEVFTEDGVLHLVFDRLEGDLLGFWLMREAPLSVPATAEIVKQLAGHLLTCGEDGQFAPPDPQNLVRTSDGEIRFLYGGPARLFGRMRNEPEEVSMLAALVYLMLTGKRVDAQGGTEPLRSLRRDVPLELENLVVRALSPDPLKRPRLHDFWRWGHRNAAHPKAIGTEAPEAATAPEVFDREEAARKPEPESDAGRKTVGEGRLRRLVLGALALGAAAGLMFFVMNPPAGDPADEALAGIVDPEAKRDAGQASEWFRESTRAYEQKNLDRAVRLGRQALGADPDRKEYFLQLANLYGAVHDYEKGLKVLRAAAGKFPNDAEIFDAMSVHAYFLKDYNLSKTAADRAVQLDRDEPRYLYHQAKAYAALNRLDEAVRILSSAVARQKENAKYHHDLAVFLLRRGRLDDAVAHAEKAAKYAGNSGERYDLTLGILYLRKREQMAGDSSLDPQEKEREMKELVNKAIDAFKKSISQKPDFAEAHYCLSVAYGVGRMYSDSLTSAEAAVRLDPHRSRYHYQLGWAFMMSGDKRGAMAALSEAKRLDPGNPLIDEALSRVERMQ